MSDWTICERSEMRGTIESTARFVKRNIDWWITNRNVEVSRRRKYFKDFLSLSDAQACINESIILGEVGPGPFGGIIQTMKLNAKRKVFIDYIMQELYGLRFISWPEDAYFVSAPAESIPLNDNAVDVLLSINCLDHGWDVWAAIKECVRISKRCYLSFDCRGDCSEEIEIRKRKPDYDHYQLLKFVDVSKFLQEDIRPIVKRVHLRNTKTKHFPVAYIEVEK